MLSSTGAYCSCSRHRDRPQSWSIRLCRRNFNLWWLRPQTHCTRRFAVRHCYNAEWVFEPQSGPLENAINNGLEQNGIAAIDVTNQPSYSPALRLRSGRFGSRRRLRSS